MVHIKIGASSNGTTTITVDGDLDAALIGRLAALVKADAERRRYLNHQAADLSLVELPDARP